MFLDELFFIYFNDYRNTMGIGYSFGLIRDEYPVGQELLNFIYLDFTEYEKHRCMLEKYIETKGKDSDRSIIEKTIMSRYHKMKQFKKRTNKPKSINDLIESGDLGEFLLSTSDEIKNHPYSSYCIANERDILHKNGLDLLFHQNRFKELIKFCFDQTYNDILNQLTAKERYYLWEKRNHNSIFSVDPSTDNSRVKTILTPSLDFTDEEKEILYSSVITQDTVNIIKAKKPEPLQLCYCSLPIQYALCEFESLVKINAKMKRCKRCGKYFILKGDYNTDYCDRILPGEKLPCKKAAAIDSRKKKVQEDLILKEYERAYKRNYARCSNHKMSKEDFRIWSEEASKKRDIASKEFSQTNSEKILKDFKEYLGNK